MLGGLGDGSPPDRHAIKGDAVASPASPESAIGPAPVLHLGFVNKMNEWMNEWKPICLTVLTDDHGSSSV